MSPPKEVLPMSSAPSRLHVLNGSAANPHIPWSSRESFTDQVCGLPDEQSGCHRWIEAERLASATSDLDVRRRDKLVELLRAGALMEVRKSPDDDLSWIGFVKEAGAADDETASAFRMWLDGPYVSPEPPEPTEQVSGRLQGDAVWFGFRDSETITSTSVPKCMRLRLNSDAPTDSTLSPIRKEGTPTSASQALLQAFGPTIFTPASPSPRMIEALGKAGFTTAPRLSEMINRYLDNRCQYREHQREVGISICHAGCRLADDHLLDRVGVSFTFIDPRTWEIRDVTTNESIGGELRFGALQPASNGRAFPRSRLK